MYYNKINLLLQLILIKYLGDYLFDNRKIDADITLKDREMIEYEKNGTDTVYNILDPERPSHAGHLNQILEKILI